MKEAGRRRLGKAERRRELIDAAWAVFGASAFDDVTIAQIAARAGASVGLIGHHFGDKRGLYIASLQASHDELLARFVHTDHATRESSPREAVEASLRTYLAFARERHVGWLALDRGSTEGRFPEVVALRDEVREIIFTGLRRRLELDHSIATAMILRGYMGFCDGAIREYLARMPKTAAARENLAEAVIEAAVEALFSALRSAERSRVR